MVSLALVLIIILGCAAFQYFKGTLVNAITTIIIAICAGVIAFGYFEVLANLIISRSNTGSLLSLVTWIQPLCFALLFILAFAILQTGALLLVRKPIDFGFLPERIGRVVCGIFLGLILSGFLLTALQMAPLPIKFPYQRFDGRRNKVLLNADGFATGLFSIISNGSFSGKRSFATVHPGYLDQLFLNRLISGASILSGSEAIEVPTKEAVWPAPDGLNKQIDQLVSELNRRGKLGDESTGESITMPGLVASNYDSMIVRVGIKKSAVIPKVAINGGIFTIPQLRLICKRKGYDKDPLAGKGVNVYPIGYLRAAEQIQVSRIIKIERNDFAGDDRVKWIDFVFCVPSGFTPTLLEFKLNNIVQIRPNAILNAAQTPPEPVFFQSSTIKDNTQEPDIPSKPPSEQSDAPPQRNQLSDISRSVIGGQLEEE